MFSSCPECGGLPGHHFWWCPVGKTETAASPWRAEVQRLRALVTRHESALVWLAFNEGRLESVAGGYRVRFKGDRIGPESKSLVGAIEAARDLRKKP